MEEIHSFVGVGNVCASEGVECCLVFRWFHKLCMESFLNTNIDSENETHIFN
jgi:hypothetical protein